MLHLQFTSSECTLINLKDLWYQKGQLLMKRPFLNDGFIASVVCLRSNLKNGRFCKRMKSCKLQFSDLQLAKSIYFCFSFLQYDRQTKRTYVGTILRQINNLRSIHIGVSLRIICQETNCASEFRNHLGSGQCLLVTQSSLLNFIFTKQSK